jgi:hypothetical protein
MQIEELIRDASAELRSATENRPLPLPRFAALPSRRKRRVWQLAFAAVLSLSVAALVVRAIGSDGKPQKVDTIAPSSTTAPIDSEPPPSFLPPPANLPNYVGVPLSKLPEVLERWGVETELVVEPGVQDPSRGRIIDQQPGGGTPLTAGMKLTFRVGAPTSLLDGEHEIGSGSTGPRGAWRVAASTKVNLGGAADGTLSYSLVFLTDQSTTIAGGSPFDTIAITRYDYVQAGLVAGTAPTSAVAVLLLDATGNTVGSVNTNRADDPHLATVSFWLIETAKHPVYASLRAIDRDGNVVAEYPGRR